MQLEDAKLKEKFLKITEEAMYTINNVEEAPARAPYESLALKLTKDDTGTKHSKLIAKPKDMNNISPYTDFGRLFQAFGGQNTDNWRGRKVELRRDEQSKWHVYPVESIAASPPTTT